MANQDEFQRIFAFLKVSAHSFGICHLLPLETNSGYLLFVCTVQETAKTFQTSQINTNGNMGIILSAHMLCSRHLTGFEFHNFTMISFAL